MNATVADLNPKTLGVNQVALQSNGGFNEVFTFFSPLTNNPVTFGH